MRFSHARVGGGQQARPQRRAQNCGRFDYELGMRRSRTVHFYTRAPPTENQTLPAAAHRAERIEYRCDGKHRISNGVRMVT